jgi:hypothetical protein
MALGKGGHKPDDSVIQQIREVLSNRDLTADQALASEDEERLTLELICEHHTRTRLSNVDVERILAIVKLADGIVSATRIDSGILGRVNTFMQPNYRGIVLSAEEHPISYFALSHADICAEKRGATILVTNRMQSLYLVPEEIDMQSFKAAIVAEVAEQLSASHETGEVFKSLYRWVSELPIRDPNVFLQRLHSDQDRVRKEIEDELTKRQRSLEARVKKGESVDERELWYGPFRILLHASKLFEAPNGLLIGTDIPIGEIKRPGSPVPDKDVPMKVAKKLAATSPLDYGARVLDLLRQNTKAPEQTGLLKVDFLHWSDEQINATAVAREAYGYYRKMLWNSRTTKRRVDGYCFSCKSRKPSRDAPTGRMRTHSWISSVAAKEKVRVCELCFVAQAYILRDAYKGAFHLDATPSYNQARIDWDKIFWDGLSTDEFKPSWVSSHNVVLDLDAETPNEALGKALGYDLKFEYQSSPVYRSYADLLLMHGLHGIISAGPQHPGTSMISGCGADIDFEQWEQYGPILKMLRETHAQKVFPVNNVWSRLTRDLWGWGTLLAERERRKMLKPYHADKVRELIKMKSEKGDGAILENIRKIPLYVADREERFKSAESVFRRMDRATLTAARHAGDYGNNEDEIVFRVAELGKKQLRARILKNSKDGAWRISDGKLQEVETALRLAARELWKLREHHNARNDFVNAAIMAVAYNPVREEE